MNNYFVILAAGKSKRFNDKIAKQFYNYKNKEIIDHSIEKSLNSNLFKKIIVVSNNLNHLKKRYPNKIEIIKGGKERSDSSLIALRYLKKFKPKNVLIHDAVRPDFSIRLLKKLIVLLKSNAAVIPFVHSKDAVKYKIKNEIFNLNREKLFLTQTPQAFRFKELYQLSTKQKKNITDEATLFINNYKKIKFIKGDNDNNKITYKTDIKTIKTYYGIGFDIHRLIKNKKLYLGGLKIPFHSGLQGHSDGDVVLHAIIDGLLGAMRKMDIGTLYPSNKKRYKNIRSPNMLSPILKKLYEDGYSINNIDINLISERPKVSKYRKKIITSLSNLLNVKKDQINLKGKTVEKLGLIGKEEAIACEAIVSLNYYA